MRLFSLLAFTVYAAESIISPLPDNVPQPVVNATKPQVSFSQLTTAASGASVLGASVEITPTPATTPLPKATPAHAPLSARKNNFTIALLGDSLVDTLGPGIPDLQTELKRFFPGVNFNLLNYGVGATNIEYGLTRITNGYNYLGNQIPSLVSQNPDIVVVESFGYNPIPNEINLDRYWLDLAHVIDSLKANLPNARILMAATIAPDAKTFGDGAAGLAFSPIDKQQHVTLIKSYLEDAVSFAKSEHLPLADAYHPSLGGDGNGLEAYINQGDHIHYSPAGRAFFARIVAGAIINNKLLE